MSKTKTRYVPTPKTDDPELLRRYALTVGVMSGATSVSEGARQMAVARNHFQSLLHRAMAAVLAALTPRPPGPTPMSEEARALRERVCHLERDNRRLLDQVQTTERLLGIAGDLIRGRVPGSSRRARQRTATKSTLEKSGPEDEEQEPMRTLVRAQALRKMGLCVELVADLARTSPSTLRRWAMRQRRGLPLRLRAQHPKRGAPAPEIAAQLDRLVRESRGLFGAEPLRRLVAGVSRRQAAEHKARTLSRIEQERRARATRVVVTTPGVVRGFDPIEVKTLDAKRFLLASADAAIAFRTSAPIAVDTSAARVADALEADFREHGAPLVWRADRAKAHDAPDVRQVLDRYGVLPLHGPPRYPGFYGQMERQHREHRAWLDALDLVDDEQLAKERDAMLRVLNFDYPRASLGWKAPYEVWNNRPTLDVDRRALREEVIERAARIGRQRGACRNTIDQAERFAIQAALMRRGFLRLVEGGWC